MTRGRQMSTFDVQSVEIAAPFSTAFHYIADPANLPEWTHAFKRASGNQATLETPGGAVEVGLRVEASERYGTVDWTITFPDGAISKAASRVTPHGDRSIYTFVLEAPPIPLERLEGALAQQSRILATELATLARRLGGKARGHA
jgi:polyketide cyclase/dehydrase/lipid transport protein